MDIVTNINDTSNVVCLIADFVIGMLVSSATKNIGRTLAMLVSQNYFRWYIYIFE